MAVQPRNGGKIAKHTQYSMRLGLVTCVWGRTRLLKAFLRHWEKLRIEGVRWRRVAVVSQEDPSEALNVVRRRRFQMVEHPNDYLSDKFNAGFKALRGKVDAVIVVGSDDFANPAYVAALIQAYRDGHSVVVPDGLYVCDLPTRRALYLRGRRIGVGRLLSSQVLDAASWEPYPSRQGYVNGNMDTRLMHLQALEKERSRPSKYQPGFINPIYTPYVLPSRENGILLDVKTPGSKNPYADFVGHARGERADFDEVTSAFPQLRKLVTRAKLEQ